MAILNIKIRRSNWEVVVFLVVSELTTCSEAVFYRTQLMAQNNRERAQKWLALFGHKKNQEKIESTMQKTLQNLRDKKYVDFIDIGTYRLTKSGVEECRRVVKETLSKGDSVENALTNHKEELHHSILQELLEILKNSKLNESWYSKVLNRRVFPV